MSNKETGGPAFPRPASEAHAHGMHSPQAGMTLRDYFAAKAMQGMTGGTWPDRDDCREISHRSYVMADAMIAARDAV